MNEAMRCLVSKLYRFSLQNSSHDRRRQQINPLTRYYLFAHDVTGNNATIEKWMVLCRGRKLVMSERGFYSWDLLLHYRESRPRLLSPNFPPSLPIVRISSLECLYEAKPSVQQELVSSQSAMNQYGLLFWVFASAFNQKISSKHESVLYFHKRIM